ncbi:proteinase-activated receptor 3-like [Alosa alosa]|uniref:proteinase-activated receptor 3-like n=1 Tax=Alosa alosa TaxID=278164 RepID=UPI0020152148|nr:proteinase-activated receptor 3-like [Alosa alosa]
MAMKVVYLNSSILHIQMLTNTTPAQQTVFESCKDMPAGFLFYLCLQFINLSLGIPANVMVLWLIHKNKGDSSTSDIFILHLAILDILFCLMPPLELVNLMYLATGHIWSTLSFVYGVKDCSLLFLSCICLDRYMAVRHPILFAELKDRQHRKVCALAMWALTLAYAVTRCVDTVPNFEKTFIVMILAAFAFMVFCNISILWALSQSGPGRDEMHPVKKRAFKMVLIILAIIVFNYLPPVALFPFKQYFVPDVFRCYIHYFAFGFMDISSSIQPMLYLSKEKLNASLCVKCKGSCCGGKAAQEVST